MIQIMLSYTYCGVISIINKFEYIPGIIYGMEFQFTYLGLQLTSTACHFEGRLFVYSQIIVMVSSVDLILKYGICGNYHGAIKICM